MKTTIEKLNKRFNAMKNAAIIWQQSCKEIATWTRPSRCKLEGDIVNDGSLFDAQVIINNTPQIAVRTFASGMLSGMTNPSRKWFRLAVEDETIKDDTEVKIWLEKAEDLVMKTFSKSNVYDALYALYEEIGLFATACSIIESDFETVIRLRNLTFGEYYIGNNNTGRVDVFAREFSMTVSQLVEEFGIENVSVPVSTSYNNKDYDRNCIIRQCIFPREQYDSSKKDNKNMPYASFYWEKDSNEDKTLRESGYTFFPVISPRWGLVASSDIYGKNSPGWESIGDCKMLQRMEQDKLKNLALVASPPMQIDENIDEYDLQPDGVTRINSLNPNSGIRPIEIVAADISRIDASIKETENRILQIWYANLFLMFANSDDPRMTATEVIKRDGEKMLVLAPALEKINNEALSPLIDITFTKILEGGLLEEPPQVLQGKNIKIDYISTIAQAQRMVGTGAIEQLASFAGSLTAVDPTVLDNINLDQAINDYADKLGVSPKILRSKEDIATIRQSRAQAQQQAQAEQQAGAMVQGAKVLSDTEIKDNTALSALLQG